LRCIFGCFGGGRDLLDLIIFSMESVSSSSSSFSS
jgi:hypothetical protein